MILTLSRGMLAVIDDDCAALASFRWWSCPSASGRFYGRRKHQGRPVYLHRAVVELCGIDIPPGAQVDHVSGDTLDNRIANLRVATVAQNRRNVSRRENNTSGYKGVVRLRGRWQAQLTCNGLKCYGGIHDTPESAARAYDEMAKEMHGAFARLNFPGGI